MFWTVDEALALVEYPRNSLLKGLKSQEIAGIQKADGEWLVDAEAFTRSHRSYLKAAEQPLFHIIVETRDAVRRVEHLEDVLRVERQRLDDLKADRDRWSSHADKLIGLFPTATSAVGIRAEPTHLQRPG